MRAFSETKKIYNDFPMYKSNSKECKSLNMNEKKFIIKNPQKLRLHDEILKENKRLFYRIVDIMKNQVIQPKFNRTRSKTSHNYDKTQKEYGISQDNLNFANKLKNTKPQIGSVYEWRRQFKKNKEIQNRLRSYKVVKDNSQLFRKVQSNYEDQVLRSYLEVSDSNEYILNEDKQSNYPEQI